LFDIGKFFVGGLDVCPVTQVKFTWFERVFATREWVVVGVVHFFRFSGAPDSILGSVRILLFELNNGVAPFLCSARFTPQRLSFSH
jgi:hypothetical protein